MLAPHPLQQLHRLAQLFQGQRQTLPHALQRAHPADQPQQVRRIQPLLAFLLHQPRLFQPAQHCFKRQPPRLDPRTAVVLAVVALYAVGNN
ncbi:MAG: hypothetical protein EXQ58_02120 [Acidobacteria bacterium]|nr:hypothetical protein [Acidobacteriota bacterium]